MTAIFTTTSEFITVTLELEQINKNSEHDPQLFLVENEWYSKLSFVVNLNSQLQFGIAG